MILKITTFCGFSLIFLTFSGFNLLEVIFNSNSLSINRKNHINIKCSLLNKTLNLDQSDRTILHKNVKNLPYIHSSDFENEIFQKSFTMSMDTENDSLK